MVYAVLIKTDPVAVSFGREECAKVDRSKKQLQYVDLLLAQM